MKKINKENFKKTLSTFATGITVVATKNNSILYGKTINSFSSLSLSPPLVLFSLDKKSSSLNIFKKTMFLGINILSKSQKNTSNYFSTKSPKWNDTKNFITKNDVPMIYGSVANIECLKVKIINQGDHVIFICKVNEILIHKTKKPLIYLNSKYL